MPSVRATAPTPAPTPMCNADWLSICRRPMRSGLPKQRSGPVLDHDGAPAGVDQLRQALQPPCGPDFPNHPRPRPSARRSARPAARAPRAATPPRRRAPSTIPAVRCCHTPLPCEVSKGNDTTLRACRLHGIPPSSVTRGDAKLDYRRFARACERDSPNSCHLPSPITLRREARPSAP